MGVGILYRDVVADDIVSGEFKLIEMPWTCFCGHDRQALLMRMLTDWIGPRGWLKKISIRHTYSTFEGDRMRNHREVVRSV